ncbi:MAG: histidine kinase [Cytophagales bacterium]|nr:histidine kinase [Cytophagales bacterium]
MKPLVFVQNQLTEKPFQWLISIGVVGLVAGAMLFVLQPLTFELKRQEPVSRYKTVRYCDLNFDGAYERICMSINEPVDHLNIIHDDRVNGQANVKGKWFRFSRPYFGDYNNNGRKEVYGASIKEDSIYVTAFEYDNYQAPLFEKFVINTETTWDDLYFDENTVWLHDINGDEYKELIFFLGAGHGIDPRIVGIYDIHRDSLWHSPTDWGAWFKPWYVGDINADGETELILGSYAPGNIKTNDYRFGDQDATLLITDPYFNLLTDPLTAAGESSGAFAFTMNDEIIGVLQSGIDPVRIYHFEGAQWREVNLPSDYEQATRILAQEAIKWRDKTIVGLSDIDQKVQYSFLNENLKKEPLPVILKSPPKVFDIDQDGQEDIIVLQDQEIAIYTGDNWWKSAVPEPMVGWLDFGVRFGQTELLFESHDLHKYYDLRKNPWFRWIWPISITAGILTFIIFGFVSNYRKYRQEAFNQRFYSLQLKALKNHVDPHFTFNILNSIRMLIIKQDSLNAEKYFDEFIKLMRHNLVNADTLKSTIAEEFGLAKSYLSLESYRLKSKFLFEVTFEEGLGEESIPKMLVQTHLENAVKHGVFHLQDRKGQIIVHAKRKAGEIIIVISDNGIGREKAREIGSESTGKGIGITEEIIKIYNALERANIHQQILDLDQGTSVEISM